MRMAAGDIFEAIDQAPEREFLLKLTAVEIYNEKVRDLLIENGDRQNLNLIEDPERGVVADGCTDIGLGSSEQLASLLKQIEARRTVSPLPLRKCTDLTFEGWFWSNSGCFSTVSLPVTKSAIPAE